MGSYLSCTGTFHLEIWRHAAYLGIKIKMRVGQARVGGFLKLLQNANAFWTLSTQYVTWQIFNVVVIIN
jgi:hypothetical protein